MRKSKASEALRVAQQIAAIRAALHKHGYQIHQLIQNPKSKILASNDYPISSHQPH